MVNIKDLNKAKVLKALWDHSTCIDRSCFGLMKLNDVGFTLDLAEREIKYLEGRRLMYNFVYGHVIKCDITDDEFDESEYDRFLGVGTAQKAIDYLRREEMIMNMNQYNGPVIDIEIIGSKNNDRIAEMFHEAFKGSNDYIDNNVIINKDPVNGKPKTGIYVCVNDLKNKNEVIDTLGITIKRTKDLQ